MMKSLIKISITLLFLNCNANEVSNFQESEAKVLTNIKNNVSLYENKTSDNTSLFATIMYKYNEADSLIELKQINAKDPHQLTRVIRYTENKRVQETLYKDANEIKESIKYSYEKFLLTEKKIGSFPGEKYFYKYNDKNQIVKKIHPTDYGDIITSYHYNKNGQIIFIKSGLNESVEAEFTYDSIGQLIEKKQFMPIDTRLVLTDKMKYYYKDGKLIKQYNFDKQGQIDYVEFEYDSIQNLIYETTYTNEGNVDFKLKYFYNTQRKVVRKEIYFSPFLLSLKGVQYTFI